MASTNSFINFNGKVIPAGTAIVGSESRGLRYGDGLFETMRVADGRICLQDLHFERLFAGLEGLRFEVPKHLSAAGLADQVLALCKKNGHLSFARVRLSVFRGDGGLYEAGGFQYVIETWGVEAGFGSFNENGLVLGVFPDGRKACDIYSSIKSNSALIYVMAALYVKEQRWNDALVLNQFGRFADSTIANLWWVDGGVIYTPPLSEGCIAGVMRRHLLAVLPLAGFRVVEKEVGPEALTAADEVFLTNALRPVRWVGSLGTARYRNKVAQSVYLVVSQNL